MSNNTEIQSVTEAEIITEYAALAAMVENLEVSAKSTIQRGAHVGALIAGAHQQHHRGQDLISWLKPMLPGYRDALIRFASRAYRTQLKDPTLMAPGQLMFAFESFDMGEPTTTAGEDSKPTAHDSSPFAAFNASALKLRHTLDQFIKARPPSKWSAREQEQIKGLVEPIIALAKQEGWI